MFAKSDFTLTTPGDCYIAGVGAGTRNVKCDETLVAKIDVKEGVNMLSFIAKTAGKYTLTLEKSRRVISLIFMSFNTQHCLNYLDKKIDFEIMADAIKAVGADVVGMQEMRSAGEVDEYTDQTGMVSEFSGLEYRYFGQAIYLEKLGPYGNSLLSRYPIISAEVIPIPDPVTKTGNKYYETRSVLKAKLEGDITVLVTHFGLNEDEQINAVKTVVENLEEKNCVLMGDFNLRPDSEILLPIRQRMKDTAVAFEKELLSYPSDTPYEKIDYIFVSPDVEVISADIPAIIASDHRPHVAELSFR